MSYSRFPAPAKYENTPKANAYRALRAAARLAAYLDRTQETHTHTNRLEELVWAEDMADGSMCAKHADLGVYACNWNSIDTYVSQVIGRQVVPGGRWPEMLGKRLENLGADTVWSDEHSVCGECHKLIRTEPSGFSWTPDYLLTDGEIVCLNCLLEHVGGEFSVLSGMTTIMWALAWADAAEEAGVSLSGCDITEVMPPSPQEVEDACQTLLCDIKRVNRTNVDGMLRAALRADISADKHIDYDTYATRLGECLVYEHLGHGVSWEDDHAPHGLDVPRGEMPCVVTDLAEKVVAADDE